MADHITTDGGEDCWLCRCGNTPADSGFYPCLETGERVEPVLGGPWVDLYVCLDCGRVIRQGTLEVVREADELVAARALQYEEDQP